MIEYLNKKPNARESFKLMKDWDNVANSDLNEQAKNMYQNHRVDCDLKNIAKEKSKLKLLAFLRYDYKKVLIRTRYLYIDQIFDIKEKKLKGDDLNFAFFEPILICFPNLEFLGRIKFPHLYNPPQRDTLGILKEMLNQIGSGYKEYSKDLVKWHRHSLSHELRPSGNWIYDLNTEDKYGPPKKINGSLLYLNIPHFIDTCILEIEKICDGLTEFQNEVIINNFIEYISKAEKDR